jgi:uncharacterized coiled-coil DUF342 family protein
VEKSKELNCFLELIDEGIKKKNDEINQLKEELFVLNEKLQDQADMYRNIETTAATRH